MKDNKISFFTAVLLNINIMIGAAIYINPPLMAAKSAGWSFLTWLLGAAIFTPVLLSVAKISSLFPGEGSFYNYSKNGLGKSLGFLSGWLYFLGYVSAASVQMMALRSLLSDEFQILWIRHYPILFNVVFFTFVCFLSSFDLKFVGKLLNAATLMKLFPLVFICSLPFFFSGQSDLSNITDSSFNVKSLTASIPFAIFGFWGFESCCNLSHRIRGSQITAALAVLLGFLITACIYSFFHFELLHVMGSKALAQEGTPCFVKSLGFQSQRFLSAFSLLISFALMCSYSTPIFGEFTTNGFLIQSMSQEKLFFLSSLLAKLNKNKQPIYAISAMGLLAFTLVTLINQDKILLLISNLGFISAFFLTLLSLLMILFKKGQYLLMLLPITGLVSCSLIANYCWENIESLVHVLPAILIAAGGFILFQIHQTLQKKIS